MAGCIRDWLQGSAWWASRRRQFGLIQETEGALSASVYGESVCWGERMWTTDFPSPCSLMSLQSALLWAPPRPETLLDPLFRESEREGGSMEEEEA